MASMIDIANELGASALTPSPCHRCGSEPVVDDAGGVVFVVLCRECYDGAEDGCREHSEGATVEVAVGRWNDTQEELLESTVSPCAYCGEEAPELSVGSDLSYVHCCGCGADGPIRGGDGQPLAPRQAVDAWNRVHGGKS